MKCPKCGATLRPSKKYPGYYLCDTCRKRYPGTSNKKTNPTKPSPLKKNASPKIKKGKKNKKPLILLLVLLLLAGIGFYLYQSGLLFPNKEGNTIPEAKTTSYSAEEAASLNGVELQILSYEVSEGNKLIKPSNGNVFLLIELEVTNTTETAITINDVSDFRGIYQGEKITYSGLAYNILSDEMVRLNGTLEGNGALSGYVCLEVPEDYDIIELEYSHPAWSNQKVVFELTKE